MPRDGAAGTEVRTTCPYCGVGCGLVVARDPDGAVSVRGDERHPANRGRICSKGSALAETLSLEGRLLAPVVGGAEAGWDRALDLVALRFRQAIEAHGPDSVAFYVSGQLLTEDYYVANKLMKGFIGSANIDTNSRLCMSSSVAGHKRAFGADIVPGLYEDLELADLVVLVGSNLAWCHPVLHQRLMAAREARPGMRIVVLDPRRTVTAELAGLHLPLAPESDIAVFNGLLAHLADAGQVDRDFIDAHVTGFEASLHAARTVSTAQAARMAGLSEEDLREFYRLYAATDRVVTVYSQGVNQSARGTDKVGAILNCHLATGRIGRPGCGPFSVTGQPNAMGGREVGGLANQLAAHADFDDPDAVERIRRFWGSPEVATRPGLKAVDLFRAAGDGRIQAIWIMSTNPVDSLPEADAVREALRRCPFVVVSDVLAHTDTTEVADVLLPAAGWGEKTGTVTNSERRISRQRAFLPMPGQARPDWWAMAELARRLGHGSAFDYPDTATIFREHAALTAVLRDGAPGLDLGALATVDDAAYETLAPTLWPRPAGARASGDGRFFADGGFLTPDRRAWMVPVPLSMPVAARDDRLVLNTGRIRDHWHTMTRTGRSPRLSAHFAEPFLEIHPDDARRRGLAPADLVVVESDRGRAILRCLVTDRQRPGSVFAPMHWTGRFAAAGRIDAVVIADTDPVSGQPASKSSTVDVRRFEASWYGFAVCRERPEPAGIAYWAAAACVGGWRVELAGDGERPAPEALLQQVAGRGTGGGDDGVLAFHDRARGLSRTAVVGAEGLDCLLFVGPDPVSVSRSWAAGLLAADGEEIDRLQLLSGRPRGDVPDPGATVCACFQVGANTIAAAIREGRCRSVAEIGRELAAGTNCGSCKGELERMLGHVPVATAV